MFSLLTILMAVAVRDDNKLRRQVVGFFPYALLTDALLTLIISVGILE